MQINGKKIGWPITRYREAQLLLWHHYNSGLGYKGKNLIKFKTDIHIRASIKKIEDSISELEKTKSVLLSLLPKSKTNASDIKITLSSGKVIDAIGRVVNGGQA